MMSTTLIVMIALAIIFDFLNGIHDSSNIVATMISSRAFSPRVALGATALAEFVGPFIFGVAVATTIGHEVVLAETITLNVLLSALLSAIVWNLLTWFLGIPSSSSHALIGGLIGAVGFSAGLDAILLTGLGKILIALFLSPILGLFLGYLFTRLIFFLARGASPKINTFFVVLKLSRPLP
jgi:PiT family inorganic phosphate transporter